MIRSVLSIVREIFLRITEINKKVLFEIIDFRIVPVSVASTIYDGIEKFRKKLSQTRFDFFSDCTKYTLPKILNLNYRLFTQDRQKRGCLFCLKIILIS